MNTSTATFTPVTHATHDLDLPVFVYGTLRPGCGNYEWALRGRTSHETDATLTGAAMFDQGGFPFVTMRPCHVTLGTVTGRLCWLDPATAKDTMASLDALEGFALHRLRSCLYERVIVDVDTVDGPVRAYTYLVGPRPRSHLDIYPHIPGGDWVEHVATRPSMRTPW